MMVMTKLSTETKFFSSLFENITTITLMINYALWWTLHGCEFSSRWLIHDHHQRHFNHTHPPPPHFHTIFLYCCKQLPRLYRCANWLLIKVKKKFVVRLLFVLYVQLMMQCTLSEHQVKMMFLGKIKLINWKPGGDGAGIWGKIYSKITQFRFSRANIQVC